MSLKLAITGGDGRASAIADWAARSGEIEEIHAFPGNDFMYLNTGVIPVVPYPDIPTTDKANIISVCRRKGITLLDVAQDNAIACGLVDDARHEGIDAIGPTLEASRLEWDKVYTRLKLQDFGLPQPEFYICHSVQEGVDFLHALPDQPWVIKANGLEYGKGVLIAENRADAIQKVHDIQKFPSARKLFLIEKFIDGEEFSAFAECDGNGFLMMGYAQDHKRVDDRDTGPNTGGMGCSGPPLVVTPDIESQVEDMFRRIIDGMKAAGIPYTGTMYLGCMVKDGKVCIIEINSRWGDPEAQLLIPGINNNYVEFHRAIIEGRIRDIKLDIRRRARVSVAGVAKGYPVDDSAACGKRIHGLIDVSKMRGIKMYPAGVRREGNDAIAAGGRLIHIVGEASEGGNVIEARDRAYEAMSTITMEGNMLQYRKDIGWRDVERLRKKGKN